MKEMTAEDMLNLQYGDQVYKYDRTNVTFRPFRYVARMPSSPDRYLIFSDGEYLTHLYINTNGEFNSIWYSGPYDDKFVTDLKVKHHQDMIEWLNKTRL